MGNVNYRFGRADKALPNCGPRLYPLLQKQTQICNMDGCMVGNCIGITYGAGKPIFCDTFLPAMAVGSKL